MPSKLTMTELREIVADNQFLVSFSDAIRLAQALIESQQALRHITLANTHREALELAVAALLPEGDDDATVVG